MRVGLMKMLWMATALTLVGCEREIPFTVDRNDDDDAIEGYMIVGKLSDRLGNPLREVAVSVFYDYVFVDDNAPPTKTYQVENGSDTVSVWVVNRKGAPLRLLFQDRISPGPLTVEWDKQVASGNIVPSSVYHVQYMVRGEVRHSYPVTVSGTVVTYSDSLGMFTIPDDNLPIDFYPVPLSLSDGSRYLGNHRIIPYLTLRFTAEGIANAVYVSLIKNDIKRIDIKF